MVGDSSDTQAAGEAPGWRLAVRPLEPPPCVCPLPCRRGLLQEGWLPVAVIGDLYLATCAERGCHKFNMLSCKTVCCSLAFSRLYLEGLL